MKIPIPSIGHVALLASAILFASSANAASDEDGIIIYNAQHESFAKSWAEGFTKDTGIKVTLRNGKDSELGNQLIQEGSSSPADVFLTENSPAMVLVDNANCLLRWMPQRKRKWLKNTGLKMGAGPALPLAARYLFIIRQKSARQNCLNP